MGSCRRRHRKMSLHWSPQSMPNHACNAPLLRESIRTRPKPAPVLGLRGLDKVPKDGSPGSVMHNQRRTWWAQRPQHRLPVGALQLVDFIVVFSIDLLPPLKRGQAVTGGAVHLAQLTHRFIHMSVYGVGGVL